MFGGGGGGGLRAVSQAGNWYFFVAPKLIACESIIQNTRVFRYFRTTEVFSF